MKQAPEDVLVVYDKHVSGRNLWCVLHVLHLLMFTHITVFSWFAFTQFTTLSSFGSDNKCHLQLLFLKEVTVKTCVVVV